MATDIRSAKAYSLRSGLTTVFSAPKVARRIPTIRDRAELGQIWINILTDVCYILTSKDLGEFTWTTFAGTASSFTTVTASTSVTSPIFRSAAAMAINATTTLDVNAVGAATIDALSLSLDATAASNLTVTGADLTVSTAVSGDVIIDSVDAFTVTAASPSSITIDADDFTVETTTSGDINVIAADALNITTGATGVVVTAPFIQLGDIKFYQGAGDPGAPLATHIGDFYLRNDAVSAVTRMFICDAIGTWVNVTCSA